MFDPTATALRCAPSGLPSMGGLLGVVLVIAVVLGVVVGPADAQTAPSSSVVVRLDADGDAEVTLLQRFDLRNESDRRAFDRIGEDATVRDRLTGQYGERMRAVIAATANETGRPMSSGPVEFETRRLDGGSTGVVALTIPWEGLAGAEGDRLVVSEPFDGGFEPTGSFVVVGPPGSSVVEVTPEPSTADGRTLKWAPGAELDGFRAVYAPGSGASGGSDTFGQPGFGFVLGAVALAAALAVARALGRP